MFDAGVEDEPGRKAAAAVQQLAALDPASADADAVALGLHAVIQLRSWLDAQEARLAARADKLSQATKSPDARSNITGSGRVSGKKASKTSKRAGTISDAPALGDALENGDIGTEHIDAITGAGDDLTDAQRRELLEPIDELADAANRMGPEVFAKWMRERARRILEAEGEERLARQKRQTKFRKWVRKDGMHVMNGEVDPELGARVFAAIDAEIESLAQREGVPKNDHTAAHALGALIDRGIGAGPNTTPTEIVLIDVETLEFGLHEHSTCEASSGVHLPPETVRRLACESIIMHQTIRGTDGVVFAAGRDVRVANRAQRRALRAMYASCAWDGCDRPFDHCQIHHINPWRFGGETDLENLLPLCSRHHHLVHEGGWNIRLDPDRTLHITEPSGRPHKTVPLATAALAQHINRERVAQHEAARARLQMLFGAAEPGRRRPTHNRAA